MFAVRASGDSMNGGKEPIRDGDWVVLRWARGQGLGAVEGRVALVAMGDPAVGQSHHLKRVVRDGDGFVLRSDNPTVAPMAAAADTVVLALKVAVVRPEDLAPPPGTRIEDSDLAGAFGLSEAPHGPVSRVDGHLFVMLEAETHPDAVVGHPGERAFVLQRNGSGTGWICLGIRDPNRPG
jgi:hypothetical protein